MHVEPIGYSLRSQRGISRGDRRGWDPNVHMPTLSEEMLAAMEEAREMLGDGQWHPKAELARICKRHGVGIDSLMAQICAADSDGEHKVWVCIPGPDTPEFAPDDEEEA